MNLNLYQKEVKIKSVLKIMDYYKKKMLKMIIKCALCSRIGNFLIKFK